MPTTKPLLLVEDDDLDAAIMRRALEQLNIRNQLVHVIDGEKALEYLGDGFGELPCVVVLDLNLPRMNGLEFLERIKADVSLKSVPVLVVTTSSAGQDIEACLKLGAVGYVAKDCSFEIFVEGMSCVVGYCAGADPRSVVSANGQANRVYY